MDKFDELAKSLSYDDLLLMQVSVVNEIIRRDEAQKKEELKNETTSGEESKVLYQTNIVIKEFFKRVSIGIHLDSKGVEKVITDEQATRIEATVFGENDRVIWKSEMSAPYTNNAYKMMLDSAMKFL